MSEEEPRIQLTGDSFTVSAGEKVSTGEYENYTPHLTLEGSVDHVGDLDEEAREELRERLLGLHGDLQAVLNRAAGNRIADPEHEDWSFETDTEAEVKEADTNE